MTYMEAVKKDIKQYIDFEVDLDQYEDMDAAYEALYDTLWLTDSVTGNASGSYTFSWEEARKCVMEDAETVTEALKEFGCDAETITKHFLDQDWEWFDVTARCYVCSSALYEVLEEIYE